LEHIEEPEATAEPVVTGDKPTVGNLHNLLVFQVLEEAPKVEG
jgi:hypothetical protein